MKKIMTVLWLIAFSLTSSLCSAQIFLSNENVHEDTLSYVENFDHFIDPIDKAKFQTGILYDRVVPHAQLHKFNPENTADTSSYKHFIQAYYEIFLASFNKSEMQSLKTIKQQVKESVKDGVIPIGILNYRFNYIDSLAIKDSILTIKNKQLHKNPNSQKPHVKKTNAFVAAILNNKLTTGENIFTLNADFIFSNTQNKIESLELDFGSNIGTFSVKPGESIKVNINTAGKLTIAYTLLLKNKKELKGYSQIDVQDAEFAKMAVSGSLNCGHVQVESDIPYTDYMGVSKKGIADMYFYYSDCGNPVLQKPIIIFDGFDPDDTRPEKQIYELMNADPFFLAKNLREKGYDIVIVNFPVGADYMVRNAYAAIEVIRWVNEHKTTNNKLVVVGPSMGGVVSRYALAKMEKDGEDHEVGLWISFDAPHQGANIAIGDQWFLKFFGETANNAGALEALEKINSPAARQLLVHHYRTYAEKPTQDYYRTRFLNEQTANGLSGSNGYPQNLRKIALLNGSGVANNQEGIEDNEYLFVMYAGPWLNGVPAAWAKVKTSSKFRYIERCVFDGRYLGYNATSRWTLRGDLPYCNTSYDIAPGGNYPTQRIIANGDRDFTVYDSSHCFIPSVSALDLSDTYLTENISTSNVIANDRTPFDDYFAPTANEEHITFSAASVNWIESELGTNSVLMGTSIVCASGATFTLNNVKAGTTVNWTKSSNLAYVSGQGTTSYKVKAKGSRIGWVQASIDYGWGPITYKKTISWVGKSGQPTITPTGYPTIEMQVGERKYFRITSSPGYPTSYRWWVIGRPSGVEITSGSTSKYCTMLANAPSWNNFYVTTSNVCGTSAAAGGVIKVIDGGGGGLIPVKLSVSPNPSDDYFEAFLENLSEEEYLNNEKLHIKLLNSRSIPVYNGVTQQKKFQINTSSFSEGLYYLQVQYKNQKYTTTIIISH